MPSIPDWLAPVRSDPAAALVVQRWRSLRKDIECSGGLRTHTAGGAQALRCDTLIACSGGCDSCALALALASDVRARASGLVLAHVVHDLRPREQAVADRDRVRGLAERLGLAVQEREIRTGDRPGNRESVARRLRYEALGEMAASLGCGVVATAHQSDDQLETMLLRMARGCGVRGLAGIAARRRLRVGVWLVRPMLAVARADAERICGSSGWQWSEDATNADVARSRARVRAEVLPVLEAISPGASGRASALAGRMQELARFVGREAERLERSAAMPVESWAQAEGASAAGPVACFERDRLRQAETLVLAELVRAVSERVAGGVGMDSADAGGTDRLVRAIRDGVGGRRELRLGLCGWTVRANVVHAASIDPK